MADPLDLDRARREGATALQLRVVEMRNEDASWRVIARALGVSVRTVREAWGTVNRRQRGGVEDEAPVRRPTLREDVTIGNEDRLRGVPVSGFGGAIKGTRPGDAVRPAERPATRPRHGVLILHEAEARGLGHDLPSAGRLARRRAR